MRSDVATQNHRDHEIKGFRGLLTNIQDPRYVPDGFLSKAINIVFDKDGNARPKDGSEQWWAPISQRTYLAEMELGEDATWTNGAVELTTVKFGYQSRVINAAGSTTMTRALATTQDLTVGGLYAAAAMSISLWARAANPGDNTTVTLQIASDAAFNNRYSWTISSDIGNLTADSWTEITKTFASGTVTGTPNLAAIGWWRISVTQTAGSNLFLDDSYVTYSSYTKSFCLGGIEFKRISNSNRYTLAAFGETVFADLNEAKAPYKILSQQTRNTPTYFEVANDRAFIFNGLDANKMFTGSSVRTVGCPKPTTNATLTPGGAGTGSMTDGLHHVGYTFVYGEGAVEHGESSMYEMASGATVNSGGANTGSIAITNLPVGAVGSGVIKRRVYCSRAAAGASATKYFVAEIADNTTTSYTIQAADATLILNADGPLDNGVPPVARFAKWFQKGMVYFTKTAFYYSRPGTNLNEKPEIVPALNFGELGNAGAVSAAVEFNSNLYLFQKHGIGKLNWNGSILEYQTVQRTAEGEAQNIGAYDQRGVTVVEDRYILWWDTEGQLWKMLPNEQVFNESENVANLLNDFNRLPLSSTLDYYRVDSAAQWDLGTTGSNLSTSQNSGNLEYKNRLNLGTAGLGTTFSVDWGSQVLRAEPQSGRTIMGGGNLVHPGASVFYTLDAGSNPTLRLRLTATQAMKLERIRFWLYSGTAGSTQVNLLVNVHNYKNEAGDGFTEGGVASSGGSTGLVSIAPNMSGGTKLEIALAPLFIPKGESVILVLTATSGFPKFYSQAAGGFVGFGMTASGIKHSLGTSTAHSIYMELTGYNGNATEQVTASFDASTTLQRWHWFKRTSAAIKAGNSITVDFEVSSDNTNWFFRSRVYSLTALPGAIDMNEPQTDEQFDFYTVPDYRVDAAYPLGIQWRYGRFRIIIDPNRVCLPSAEIYTAISHTEGVSFPSLVAPVMTKSTQASFVSYDKADYANDIWTSEIVNAGSIASAKLSGEYVENQQRIYFQIRSATSSGGIAAAAWNDITPNVPVASGVLVANATHFQVRIIMQDDETKVIGEPSYVGQMTLSYAGAAAEAAPVLPPTLFYYKNYIFGSWPSRNSRVLDRSLALDAYYQTYEEDVPHRFSTFGAPHYGAYFMVGGKLIGGPVSNGKLMHLCNSKIADDNSSTALGPICILETVPSIMRTSYIKTLHTMYLGMNLNIHRDGYVVGDSGGYPSIGGTLPWGFWWAAGALKASLASSSGPVDPLGISAYGAYKGQGVYNTQIAHSGDISQLVNFYRYKPYITEYGFEMGLQERAFAVFLRMQAAKDTNGNAFFPTLASIGFEFFAENIRGV